jgi:beta-glucosidase/6-phospho-beta-glucosidase/beta-galactosidase
VSEIASHFAKDVPYWITFNEPNLLRSSKPKIRRLKWEEQVAFSEDYFIARQQLLVGSKFFRCSQQGWPATR